MASAPAFPFRLQEQPPATPLGARELQPRGTGGRGGAATPIYVEGGAGVVWHLDAYRNRQRAEATTARRRAEREAASEAAGYEGDGARRLRAREAAPALLRSGYAAVEARLAKEDEAAEAIERKAFRALERLEPAERDRAFLELQRGRWLGELEAQTRVLRERHARHFEQRELELRRKRAGAAVDAQIDRLVRVFCRGLDERHSVRVAVGDALTRAEPGYLRACAESYRQQGPEAVAHLLDLAANLRENKRTLTRLGVARKGPNPWHVARAKGARERFDAVVNCGASRDLILTCTSCGHERKMPLGCSQRFFCSRCRELAAARYGDQIRRPLKGLVRAAESVGLLYRKGDRNLAASARARGAELLSERLITLTVPHFAEDTVTARLERLTAARSLFFRRLREHHVERFEGSDLLHVRAPRGENGERRAISSARQLCHYFSALELTEGSDGRGHPHLHVLHFGPFLPVSLVRRWWTEALAATCERTREHFAQAVELDADIAALEAERAALVDHYWSALAAGSSAGSSPAAARARRMLRTSRARVLEALDVSAQPTLARETWQRLVLVARELERLDALDVPRAIVDVRAVRGGWVDELDGRGERTGRRVPVEREMVKYLLKDWTSGAKGKRVAPEFMAEAWGYLQNLRMRQTSAGLSHWAIPLARVCSCCANRTAPTSRIAMVTRLDPLTPPWRYGDAWEEPTRPTIASLAERDAIDLEALAHYEAHEDRWWSRFRREHPAGEYALRRARAMLRTVLPRAEHFTSRIDQLKLWGNQ